MSVYLNIRKIPRNFTYLQIFDLRLQTFVDIGKNQYFQTLHVSVLHKFTFWILAVALNILQFILRRF